MRMDRSFYRAMHEPQFLTFLPHAAQVAAFELKERLTLNSQQTLSAFFSHVISAPVVGLALMSLM